MSEHGASTASLGAEAFLPASACPRCGRVVDRARVVGHSAVPHPGDVTVCIYCGEPSFFTHDMQLRAPEADEWAEIRDHAELRRVIEAVKSAASSRRPAP